MAKRKSVKMFPRKGVIGRRGKTGATGRTGPVGPQGPPGVDQSEDIARLSAQVEVLAGELRTQLVRIGQLQAQLDRLVTARSSEPRNRRTTDRSEE